MHPSALSAALLILLLLTTASAAGRKITVPNVGREDFSTLPEASPWRWNVQNLEYPPEAITIEDLGEGNTGLRIGSPDASQPGRLTITLRAKTHDWSPTEVGEENVVRIRFSAVYSGSAVISVSSPGGGAWVDIGRGALTIRQRVGAETQVVDHTAEVQQALGGAWNPANLHVYTIRWSPTGQVGNVPCSLEIDDVPILSFLGGDRPLHFDSCLEISLENGVGTGLVDWVEWSINGGKPKPEPVDPPFMVLPGVRQLFLDDFGIESLQGLRRVVNQPTRYPGNPVLKGEHPWKMASTSVYGTMLYDPEAKQFRLWYLCTPGPQPSGRKWVEVGGYRRVTNCTLLAYATSPDAIHWDKPVLNQLSFEGSTQNNLLDIGIDNPEGVGILHDPHDPDPSRRFKAFFWDRRVAPPDDPTGVDETAARVPVDPPWLTDAQRAGGMWVAFSPDGIRWTTHGPVLPQATDTTHTILYDPVRQEYVAFGRMGFGRTVARTESPDALNWSEPELVLACDGQDGPGGQIYGMPIDLYEGIYIGMLWMYREGVDARIDTQLAVSRDGIEWERVADRQTFLANGLCITHILWAQGAGRLLRAGKRQPTASGRLARRGGEARIRGFVVGVVWLRTAGLTATGRSPGRATLSSAPTHGW